MSIENISNSSVLKIKSIRKFNEIAEQGDGTVLGYIEGKEYHRPPPFFLDATHVAPAQLSYFNLIQQQIVCPERRIGLMELHNASVVGQGAVFTSTASLLFDSVAEFINHGLTPDGFIENQLNLTVNLQNKKYIYGNTALLKRPWYRNYGHFMVDLLPLLSLWRDFGVEFDNLIFGEVPPGNLYDFMVASAQKTYPSAKCIFADDKEILECEHLFYVEPIHVPPLFKHPMAVSKAKELALQIYGNGTGKHGDERIYISRKNVRTRNIANSDEIESLLAELGFKTVFPELLSMEDQIGLFQRSKFVVGSKGAGLTNIIFCHPRTHVLAFSSSGFVDPFFWDLSSHVGLLYSEIFGQGDSYNPAIADFSIDTIKVMEFAKFAGLM